MATELLQSIGSARDPLVVDLRFSNYIQITPHCPHAAQSIGSKMFSHKETYSDFLAVRHQLCGVESARKALKVMFNIPQCHFRRVAIRCENCSTNTPHGIHAILPQ